MHTTYKQPSTPEAVTTSKSRLPSSLHHYTKTNTHHPPHSPLHLPCPTARDPRDHHPSPHRSKIPIMIMTSSKARLLNTSTRFPLKILIPPLLLSSLLMLQLSNSFVKLYTPLLLMSSNKNRPFVAYSVRTLQELILPPSRLPFWMSQLILRLTLITKTRRFEVSLENNYSCRNVPWSYDRL